MNNYLFQLSHYLESIIIARDLGGGGLVVHLKVIPYLNVELGKKRNSTRIYLLSLSHKHYNKDLIMQFLTKKKCNIIEYNVQYAKFLYS